MEKSIKKVLIITNFNIYDKAQAALRVAEKLSSMGCEVCTLVYNKDKIIRLKSRVWFTFFSADEAYREVDAVVVLGGDGTILESARRCAPFGTPVLGLNLGRLGYMAEIELGEIDKLEKIVRGDYTLETRSMINIEILNADGGEVRKSEYTLNDAVLSNGSISRVVDIELSEGGVPIASYRSDGMIVSTPTGSTAYSLAAGGAIVDPRLECLLVTPICPHSLYARPMVFPDSACLEIKNTCQREKTLFLTVDGRVNYELSLGDVVRITRSPLKTCFIRLKDASFYEKLRQKMTDK
jgi:NAD+ kinase